MNNREKEGSGIPLEPYLCFSEPKQSNPILCARAMHAAQLRGDHVNYLPSVPTSSNAASRHSRRRRINSPSSSLSSLHISFTSIYLSLLNRSRYLHSSRGFFVIGFLPACICRTKSTIPHLAAETHHESSRISHHI